MCKQASLIVVSIVLLSLGATTGRLAAQSLFASPTIQKNRLLRPFPQMSVGANGLVAQALPIGKVRTHAIEVSFQRRFSQGLSLNVG